MTIIIVFFFPRKKLTLFLIKNQRGITREVIASTLCIPICSTNTILSETLKLTKINSAYVPKVVDQKSATYINRDCQSILSHFRNVIKLMPAFWGGVEMKEIACTNPKGKVIFTEM